MKKKKNAWDIANRAVQTNGKCIDVMVGEQRCLYTQ